MTAYQRAVAPWSARLHHIDDLAPGSCVVVACSGGADSLALLALASARDFDVIAVHVDHGLRGDTQHDADVVRAAATEVGARVRVMTVAFDASANLEARARDARYATLEIAADEAGAAAILVAHTRDDQAETVLLSMLRGSGAAGLAGMPAIRGRVRRPLLELRRAETHEICARLRWAPVRDPMNDELRHRRVWLRREVIPSLERGAQRDLVEVLARQAALLRDDDDLLDALAAEHAPDDAGALAALSPAFARRVVRQWLGPPPPASGTVEAVLEVARGERRAVELPGGHRVERVGARLHLVTSAELAAEHAAPAPLAVPGRTRFGSGRGRDVGGDCAARCVARRPDVRRRRRRLRGRRRDGAERASGRALPAAGSGRIQARARRARRCGRTGRPAGELPDRERRRRRRRLRGLRAVGRRLPYRPSGACHAADAPIPVDERRAMLIADCHV